MYSITNIKIMKCFLSDIMQSTRQLEKHVGRMEEKKKLSTQNLILGERIFQNTSQINSLQNTQRLKVLFLPNELRRRKEERECVSGRRKPAADGNHHVYKE